jgi:hypothetical protein
MPCAAPRECASRSGSLQVIRASNRKPLTRRNDAGSTLLYDKALQQRQRLSVGSSKVNGLRWQKQKEKLFLDSGQSARMSRHAVNRCKYVAEA